MKILFFLTSFLPVGFPSLSSSSTSHSSTTEDLAQYAGCSGLCAGAIRLQLSPSSIEWKPGRVCDSFLGSAFSAFSCSLLIELSVAP